MEAGNTGENKSVRLIFFQVLLLNVYFRSGRKHSGSIPFPCLHNPLGAEPHKLTFHFHCIKEIKMFLQAKYKFGSFFPALTFFACICCCHTEFYGQTFMLSESKIPRCFTFLCPLTYIWFCVTHFAWGSTTSAVPCQVRLPVQTGNPFAAIPQNSFHTDSTEKPWSPENIQLIKSVCFSTFPKTFFAFQERREEFPWNLPSALSKLARSRPRAATPASPLSSF